QYWRDLKSNTIGSEMKWTNVVVLKGGRDGTEGSEGGRQAQEGEEGEICIRGPVIMKKYLKNPTATEEAFKYEWFHSGDLGYWKKVDGRKQFFLKGRIKEIIIKAGVNVSPMAVEEKILESLLRVDQAYVVGIPDGRVGEEIGAVAVWKDKGRRIKEEGRRWGRIGGIRGIREIRGLSEFETPRYWFSIPAEKLPMTSTGKVQRVKLKEMFGGCAAIAEAGKYMFRVVVAEEEGVLEEARKMYNDRWRPLSADKKSWQDELKRKILIAAFNKETGRLAGWIRLIEEGKTAVADAVTAGESKGIYRNLKEFNGTFRRDVKFRKLHAAEINKYLNLGIDPVIEFHRKAKAGWKRGAKIVKAVENARPGDTPALGYGVLMEYPEFNKMPQPKVLAGASLGTQLVEAGLIYAKKEGFDRVRVLSRPVGLLKWVIRNTRKTRKARLSDSRRIGGSEG
ncbi:MAG: Acyl-CoA synthetases (AMP-forming)/AMP-acid ligases II, partial [Candidatus Woesebacteria bacterium GW2011_GWA2_44_33]